MGVAAFWVQSERSGYVVEPLDRVKGATASIVQPRRQPSAPDPGPTLSIRLTRAPAAQAPGALLGPDRPGGGSGRRARRGRAVGAGERQLRLVGRRVRGRAGSRGGLEGSRLIESRRRSAPDDKVDHVGRRPRRLEIPRPPPTQPQFRPSARQRGQHRARRPPPAAQRRPRPRPATPAARTDRRPPSSPSAPPHGPAHTAPSGRAARTPPATWRRAPRGTAARDGRAPRGPRRGRRGTGDTSATSTTTPASASSADTSAVRRTFSARSSAEKPRSPLRPWRRLSPSST